MSEPQNGRGALFAGGLAAILASTCCGAASRGLTLSGTKTHVKQRFLPLTPLLMVSDVLWSPVLPA